mgnify:CR=1 FL=1
MTMDKNFMKSETLVKFIRVDYITLLNIFTAARRFS